MVNSDGDNLGQVGAPGDLPGAAVPVDGGARRGRRGRVLLISSVAAVVAAGVIAVPVFAASSSLPSISAQQLLTKMLSSKVRTFSGTVQSTVDLGLPSQLVSALPSALGGDLGGDLSGDLSGDLGGEAGPAGAGGGATASASAAAEQELSSLLSGTQLFRVAADGPGRQALTSTDPATGFALVHDGGSAWLYDARGHSATHLTGLRAEDAATSVQPMLDPQRAAADALRELGSSTTVSVSGQSKVAGQSVYELSARPKGGGSTVGEVRIAVDAANGMPLEVRVLPSDGSDPILDVGFSSVSFAAPAADAFTFTPPSGTKVVQQAVPAEESASPKHPDSNSDNSDSGHNAGHDAGSDPDLTVSGSGWSRVWIVKPSAQQGGTSASGELSAVKEYGKPVADGTLVSTKLVNVLVANDGTVYAGAVTPSVLEAVAGS